MSHTIEISDKTFAMLRRRAKMAGVAVNDLIEQTLRGSEAKLLERNGNSNGSEIPLSEAMKNFIGAAARLPKPTRPHKRSPFGEILVKKYRKQGLKLDYDID